ncbi:MAG: dTDP-glucose 4,6-dehydratase [Candidatus Aenigmarchaeota archaeon]|nr:dTDP-glucose 4,6-dehydratase [Candidatus Aenigmarchaeota archaeon]
MSKKVLVTGGCGFIGSNFVHYMLEKHPDYGIVVLDKLTYAGKKENLASVMDKIEFIHGDICNKGDVEKAVKDCDFVVNFAAETHVDRSIVDSESFILTEVLGVGRLLEAAKETNVERFVQISTDEVYGSIKNGSFKETDSLNPRNPYAACKAAAELLTKSYFETFNTPILITRTTNNHGPFQNAEKFIPKIVINALRNKPVPIYGNGQQVRDWIYVLDNCEAVDIVLHKGKLGETYNIKGGNEKTNLELVKQILKILGKPESLISFITDRLGHDERYSLDDTKIRNGLGWKPSTTFGDAIKKTVQWYIDNESWWSNA